MAERDDDYTVNIAELSRRIQDDVAALRKLPRDCTIYKVPARSLRGNEFAFKPLVVSIGPYHYGEKELLPMQEHKIRFFGDFCRRTKQVNPDGCLRLVEQKREKLRRCYAEDTTNISDADFVYMILLDACFTIELFLRLFFNEIFHADQVLRKPVKLPELAHDLMLLANQLPFFILEDLFNLSCKHIRKAPGHPFPGELSMINIARVYCQYVWDLEYMPALEPSIGDVRPSHLLDLMRISHAFPAVTRPSVARVPNVENTLRPSACTARNLLLSGVKFKVSPSKNLFDIKFQENVLEMPKLKLNTFTETWLRNLMVLEQLERIGAPLFMNEYIMVINFLVNTPKDVEVLTKHGIIVALWGPEEVSSLFHKILVDCDVDPVNSHFVNLVEEMSKHSQHGFRKWNADEIEERCKVASWAIVKLVAAIAAFAFGIAQLISSYIQLSRKRHSS